MKISDLECFALLKIFQDDDALSTCIRSQLEFTDKLDVIERNFTGVGFISAIKIPFPVDHSSVWQRDWIFNHRCLSHGGSFSGWFSGDKISELEGVVNYGLWPDIFKEDDFFEC